jgi:hypothetical protein
LARCCGGTENLKLNFKLGHYSANISKQQKELLIELINNHPNILSCKFSSTFTAADCRKLWEELTVCLNSVPTGNTKDWKAWRKVRKLLTLRCYISLLHLL